MLSPDLSRDALQRLFQKRRIADLELLFRTLDTTSTMSVFRRLSSVGYRTSYSHARRFYTLVDIPEFDENGLWQYQGVFFSRQGTLKETVGHLVDASDAGHTHKELQVLLRVHIHNTLLDLVNGKRIGRQLLDGLFLYVSAVPERASAQLSRRRQRVVSVIQPSTGCGQPLEIAVLLEIIHGARLIPGPAQIAERLVSKGVQVSGEHVETLFQKYGLKKTPGPRSRSSRR